jgi:predicted short-subunit dehydrogenase-like oxidoreductase (DUF2520 family)
LNKKKVVIIGAGAVGKSIGYLLAKNGYQVLGFISKSLDSAQAGVELLGGGFATTEYDDFILKADLILITTPDEVIKKVAKDIFDQELVKKGSCLIHCSGALTSKILVPEVDKCGDYGQLSLHPLQSIANVEKGIDSLAKSFFTIEGNEIGREVGEEIIKSFGADYEVINAEVKPIYHAAACVASNYLVAILDLALTMNKKAGISPEKALSGLLPLIKGTLDNIEDLGTVQSLTGPISRGDVEVIKNHLDVLKEIFPDALELYQGLGVYTADIAKKKRSITAKEFAELNKILE